MQHRSMIEGRGSRAAHVAALALSLLVGGAALGCQEREEAERQPPMGEQPDGMGTDQPGGAEPYDPGATQPEGRPDPGPGASGMPREGAASQGIDVSRVEVETSEETVEVPAGAAGSETQEVQVPVIRLELGDQGETAEAERQTLTVGFDVPHAGFVLEVDEVHLQPDRLLVIARLNESDQAAAQQITRVEDHIVVEAPPMNVEYFVVGEQPETASDADVTFVQDRSEIDQQLAGGRLLYDRDESPAAASAEQGSGAIEEG